MSEEEKRGPDYTAFNVREYAKDKSAWDRIGVAFRHRDGKGTDIILNTVPLDGRITLREAQKEEFKTRRNEESEHGQDRSRPRRR
nr:hypothetical protein [Nitrosomonas nitrosa]